MQNALHTTLSVRDLPASMKHHVDYSLYLVTDSTDAILGSRDLVHVVEQALLGGKYSSSVSPANLSNL